MLACIFSPKDLSVRGYVTRGLIYHSGHDVFGSGHLDVLDKEKGVSIFKREADERGTPFIEVDPVIPQFIESHGDECIKQMFERLVKTEGPLTALYPFQFITSIGGDKFDRTRRKLSNDKLRTSLKKVRQNTIEMTNVADARALQKSQHYIRAIDAQLAVCDRIDIDIGPVP